MAVVTDTFVPIISRTVFLKPRDMVRELTPIPRALLNFTVAAAAVSAKPLNDTYHSSVSIVLPFQFAYRLVELTQSIRQDTANDYADTAYLQVVNGIRRIPQGVIIDFPWSIASSFTTVSLEMNVVVPQHGNKAPRGILQSILPRISPVVTFISHNVTAAAAAAGNLSFFASFLEYDLEQVERYPVHYPVQIFSR